MVSGERDRAGGGMSGRSTAQGRAIRRALEAAGRPLGPREILDAAQQDSPSLGIATVYRNVKALLDQGWLAQVELPGEPPRYERAGKRHHHHFMCRTCDRLFELAGCPTDLETLVPAGFRLEAHEVVLYGSCDECTAGR
jgi:Fur family transcriptional regulator, ferric uptake regulator